MYRELKHRINTFFIYTFALTGIIMLISIFIFIVKESLPALKNFGADLFLNFDWYPTSDPASYGLLTMLFDSLIITFLSSVIVLPLGYIIAFFMNNYSKNNEKKILKYSVELLSGVPSVIIGMFLLIYISPWMLNIGAWSQENLLLGSVGLVIISLPYTSSLMEEAMDSVDKSLKESSLALGATKFTTGFKIISRASMSGILNSSILTINRIIGETMIVLMAAGGANMIPTNILDPVRTLTAAIASEMGEVELGSIHYSSLFVAGLILLIISIILTTISKKISRSFKV
ncbi:phosphate ABC transporter permease [Tepiditoga spiralis]|uniref:Phosphate transport system permease protein n=1 Tax=Tepiditoga spiralis TaxID=2108365 RepID=A0A7G1G4W4_9BACT|nr:phosphate ABC transporter permease subunit PstC [Tepiditoga spiralis]BBE31588.1 phosphate ABC transporter permease [Tepiditoga spiralis]